MDKFAELKKEYGDLLSCVRERSPAWEDDEAFFSYYIVAVLKIWGNNVLYSSGYAELLRTVYTIEQVVTAMGGVLFIDKAYSLAGEADDSYGREAIETILKAMEDHRNELVVIVAGDTELMHRFIGSDPGLSSRFSKYFEYPDYSGEELLAIFQRFCGVNGYVLNAGAAELLRRKFDVLYAARDEHFGNARTARDIFEKAINAQADRIALQDDISDEDLVNITVQDITAAIGGAV